jgi:hypothetical protein
MCNETLSRTLGNDSRHAGLSSRILSPLVAALTLWAGCGAANAADLVDVRPLTDRIVMVHFDDGHVEHHKKGQPRSAEKVVTAPLDVSRAVLPRSYAVSSTDDAAFKKPLAPVRVGRKSKGTDFAWFVDKMENGVTVNSRPDHAAEHWLYLELPAPMKPGKTYTIRTEGLATKLPTRTLTYSVGKSRSEAVHVNTLGYVPDAPQKFAYVYHWMGDNGSLDLKQVEGKPFHVLNAKTGKRVFTGAVRFRKPKTTQETAHTSDSPPNGNFLNADVWECDFSALRTPGAYVVAVEGVGCSWPFRIDPDVYREAFRTVARGLYHNRSGIALTKPYTEFERPAPHHPKLTPGFAGKLRYTRVRWQDWGSEGGDAKKLMADSPGTLEDAWGWYQDAGDWDGYYTHLRPAQELLLVFEMGHRKFTDGELNLPESGNGIPDIVDEAAWLPRFCYRLRHELLRKKWGTGGIGLRVAGDAFGSDEGTNPDGSKFGRPSYEDTDRVYMVSGEDAQSTYRFAGVAASLAHAYRLAGVKRDPAGIDWEKEARESYAWAQKNTRPGDEKGDVRKPRSYAAAALFRLSGDKAYEAQFIRDTESVKPDSMVYEEDAYGPFVYALGGGAFDARRDPAVLARIRDAVLRTADETMINTSAKRALRWGGNFYFPMLVGQQTTPLVLEGTVGYTLTKDTDPARARAYLAALYTTCDYFLGTNALNQTWVTGLGPRHPTEIFHMDAWYNGKETMHPGLIPYSPWRKEKTVGQGPWSADWGNKTVYPEVDAWPGNERWWNNRCSPMGSEFTIHQNTGPAAAIFGFLCAETLSK